VDFNALLSQFGTLAGFAALVAVVINLMKAAGFIQDGQAQTWSAAFNLLGLAALLYLRVFQPQADITYLDTQAAQIANILLIVGGYIIQLGGSKLTHILLSGTPLIGKSFTPNYKLPPSIQPK
jgi:hypothetical protein